METRPLSLQDQIRTALELDLEQGVLTPGMAINEAALCERFRTSRTPVREALLLLSAKGMLCIIPRSGIFVRQLDARELVAVMEGLAELEGVLARLAAKRAETGTVKRLVAALARTAAHANANDPLGYEHANAALHELIYEVSGNPIIVEQTRQLRLRIASYRGRLFEKPGRLEKSQLEHEAIVRAVVKGDCVQAAEAMREHISAGGKVFADMVLTAPAAKPLYRPVRARRNVMND